MKIHSLRLKNFMLYKDFYQEFDDKDIIAINCKYFDNKHKSNRGGKTTIVEAICYALFGESRAKKEIELIHHGKNLMYVELVLIKNDKKYKIKRGKDINNKTIYEVGFLEKSKEVKSEIESLIGFNKNDFLLTNYFKQNEINSFMLLNHADKKKYLMQWLGNSYWVDYENKVNEKLKIENKRLQNLIFKSDHYQDEIEELDDIKIESVIKSIKNEIKIYKNKLEKHKKIHNVILSKYEFYTDNYNTYKNNLSKLEKEVKKIKLDYQSKIEYKNEYKESLKEYNKLESKNIKYNDSNLMDLINKESQLTQKIEAMKLDIKKMEESFCGICPVLNEQCDRIEKDDLSLNAKRDFLKKLKDDLEINSNKIKIEVNAKKHQNKLKDLKLHLYKLKTKFNDMDSLKKLIVEKLYKVKELENEIDDKLDHDIVSKYKTSKEKYIKLEKKLKVLNETLGVSTASMESIKRLKENKIRTDREIKTLKKEIDNLRYVSFMFSKNGIPSQQIENAFDSIENEINFILRKLETDLQVIFNPEKELNKWESHCISCGKEFEKNKKNIECKYCGTLRQKQKKDELHIKILENNSESNFEMESGGGKTLVSLAVRIALSKLKMSQTDSNFNVIFLDEPDSSLDGHNKKTFIKLITELLIKNFGFEQIFWITHEKNIQESIENVLQITRFNTYSKACFL